MASALFDVAFQSLHYSTCLVYSALLNIEVEDSTTQRVTLSYEQPLD